MNNKPLLFQRSFWPIFMTQFWGALNDNMLKNALIILITFRSHSIFGLSVDQMVALCGGIFILPFFLFSSVSGQLSDRLSKSSLIVGTKILELVIVVLSSFGFIFENILLLICCLFLIGVQSTIFGPAKYSILPELLNEDDLVKGNALVEMGTFLAILIGTIFGGVIIGFDQGSIYISIGLIVLSLIGLYSSLKIPKLLPVDPQLHVDANFFKSTLEILKISQKTKSVFISILGISWFWFFGAILLSIFPVYVKNILFGNEGVVTFFLAIFSIGVAVGSIICERLSHKRVELGLVPFGSLGMCVFLLHLYFIGSPYAKLDHIIGPMEFFEQQNTFWILFDLFGLSVMSGFFIVPLYTFIQVRSDRNERSRVIAANNIMNALFMVVGSVLLMVLFSFGLTATDIFLVLFILNVLVSIYIYTVIPEFLLRFVCVIFARLIYRIRVTGLEHVPHEGPAVLIVNHVSFIDWLVVAASLKRPVRFVMHYSFMKTPIFSFFFKGAKVIPIAGQKEDPELLQKAFELISATLEDGEVVCIFPEGQITHDGKLNSFRSGVEKIVSRNPVPVIPMALDGLWGSFFSRKYGSALTKFSVIPSNWLKRVSLTISSPVAPETVQVSELELKIKEMLNQK